MKLKKQFVILSSLIISIPILCSVFIIIHTYIHSPNRYLIKGSARLTQADFPLLSEKDISNIQTSLKMLPQGVEAALCRTTDRKILYSTMPDIAVGSYFEKDQIVSLEENTSNQYYYQFSKMPSAGNDILLITRLPLTRINNEKKTKNYLKVLFAVILITITSLALIVLISKAIFDGLKKIDYSSSQLAEGKLKTPVSTENNPSNQNEFTSIMKSLEKMRCELLEMQESKNRFITGISHDLRTPVAVIKGYTEAMMDDVISDKTEIKKSLDLIERKASQLEGMIDTLINFMKLNSTEIKQKLEKHSITKLITDYAKYCQVTGKVFKRNVTTNIQLPQNIEVPLNDELIHRAFENLFSNAIRYTNEDDLIEINAFTIEGINGRSIILEIKDSGPGIDKKDLDYIFEIFYRGTNSRKEEGLGIGLSVVKSIMETHGWTIKVQSQKRKGTTFTISIPY